MNPQPNSPISADERAWIDGRVRWLLEKFPQEEFLSRKVVTPTDTDFPDGELPSLKKRVKSYMLIQQPRDDRIKPVYSSLQSILEIEDYQLVIDPSDLGDPADVIASLARQIALIQLECIPGANEFDDLLPLADLLTILSGLGVFTANSTVREAVWDLKLIPEPSRHNGQLSPNAHGYALALYALLRNDVANWAQFLRDEVRSAFVQSMDFLSASGEAEMSLVEGKAVRPFPRPESDSRDDGEVRPLSRCPFCNSALTIADQAGVCRECGRAIRAMELEKALADDEILASQNDRAGAYLLLAFIIGLVLLGFIFG